MQMADDRVPIIDHVPSYPNIVFAAGMSGDFLIILSAWFYCSLTIMYCLACIYVVSPSLIVSIIAPCMSLCISISVEYVYCYTVGMSHSYHKCAFPYAFRTWSHDCSSCWTVTDRTNTQKTTVH